MDERDLGDLGEDALRTWCSQIGITCNKSTKDKEGWDYILEFEGGEKQSSTIDEKPPRYKCFLQVKASDNSTSNKSISLRNWEKMVNDNHPFFILRVEFDGQINPQRAYLIHVDKELIGKALKRLREFSSDQAFLLKHKTLSYPRRNKDLLNDLEGLSLKEKLKSSIQGGMFNYSQWKARLVKTIGFESEELQFTFQAVPNKSPCRLLLFSVQLKVEDLG